MSGRPSDGTDLLQVLVFCKVLTPDQIEPIRRTAKVKGTPIEHAIVSLGIATEVQIAEALASYSGLRFVKINPLDLDLDVVTTALSGPFARRHGLIAISKNETTLTVAVHDPLAPFPLDDIRSVTGLDVERVVATRSDVDALNRAFYGLKTSLKSAEKQLTSSWLSVDLGNQEFLSAETEELDPAAAPVISALDHILSYAFEQRASDIHFEPKRDATLVRLRIDGVLHEVHLIPTMVYQAIVSRIKLLSGCNLAEKRRPQDGRIKREQGGREIELRVSTMPTAFGEKAVLRIFDPDILLKQVNQLGFSDVELPHLLQLPVEDDRHHPRHRPDRQRKDDDAVLGAEIPGEARSEHRHDRRPDRNGPRGVQSGGRAAADRRDVRQCAAHRAAAGSRHHHGRRNPRYRNRGVCGAGRADRPPRAVDAAHQRRAIIDHAPARPEGARLPDQLDGPRHPGTASRARHLHALRRRIRAHLRRVARCEHPVRRTVAALAQEEGGVACIAGRPVTAAATASSRFCRLPTRSAASSPSRPTASGCSMRGAKPACGRFAKPQSRKC